MYGSPFRPQFRPKGGPCKLCTAAEESLAEYMKMRPWAIQKEMVWFLWEEWDLYVHQSTVLRTLKRLRLSQKIGQRVGHRRNEELVRPNQSINRYRLFDRA